MKALQKAIHAWAKRKGWWENPNRPIGEQIANMHSELSEAWEEFRMGNSFSGVDVVEDSNRKPCGFGIELADVVIRIMDTCERYDIDLEQMIAKKMAYNEGRPYRHGGKLA